MPKKKTNSVKETKPMSKLETLINEEQQRSDSWKEQKDAEREELNTMSDEMVTKATTEPETYLRYLELQADNPAYSASNILLALSQKPEVTMLHSLEQWNKLGRSIKPQETGVKVRVSAPYEKDGRKLYGYKVGRAFDVSQTTGKDLAEKVPVEENTPEMDAALRKLIRMSPVPVKSSAEVAGDALYDPKEKTIEVSPELSDAQTFSALAREIYHASSHENNKAIEYDRGENELDAQSVGYMLCRSFGIECKQPDAADVAAFYTDMEPQERRDIFDGMRQSFRVMQQEIQKELAPPAKEQTRGAKRRGASR